MTEDFYGDEYELIAEAFYDENVAEFKRLIGQHPKYLLDDEGQDAWLFDAASGGNLAMVQTLLDFGADVNAPNDSEPESSPLFRPEGAIVMATYSNHIDVVRCLLGHGAKINYIVHGKQRCRPLLNAVRTGNLEMVQLLVEHGADIHAISGRTNAVLEADIWGHAEIRDYLESLGAKDLRDLVPPDFKAAHRRVIDAIVKHRGPLSPWVHVVNGNPDVTFHLIEGNEKSNGEHTVFTTGLSDRRLPHDDNRYAAIELRLMLSPDWNVTSDDLKNPKWGWPFDELERIIRDIQKSGYFPAKPAIFQNPNGSALDVGTNFSAWLCLMSVKETEKMPDHRRINIYNLFPIYEEERQLVLLEGVETLLNRFAVLELPLFITPNRSNVATLNRDWPDKIQSEICE